MTLRLPLLLAAATGLTLVVFACAGSSPPPQVLPEKPSPALESAAEVDSPSLGELLLGELRCTACHPATPTVEARLQTKKAPSLSRVAARTTVPYLRRFLSAPQEVKPGTTMPSLFHGMRPDLREEVVEDLIHYLMSLAEPSPAADVDFGPELITTGRRLFHTVGCVACHPAQAPAQEFQQDVVGGWLGDPFADEDDEDFEDLEPADSSENLAKNADGLKWLQTKVELGEPDARFDLHSLSAFLQNPLQLRPSGRMPDLQLSPLEAKAIAAYLLEDQYHRAQEQLPARRAGLIYLYYEGNFLQQEPEWDQLEPLRQGRSDGFHLHLPHRGENFGFVFQGQLYIAEPGEYTFYTASDDGSHLFINDTLVVDNGGNHGVVERAGIIRLEAGWHPIRVDYYEAGGGEELEVQYQGPGFTKRKIPKDVLEHEVQLMSPTRDPAWQVDSIRAARGRSRFLRHGCASCHDVGPWQSDQEPIMAGPALHDLAGETGGCLAEHPNQELPDFDLNQEERQSLRQVLFRSRRLAEPQTAEDILLQGLTRLRCLACHQRDGLGGPKAETRDYFTIHGFGELGDEGRIPPDLSVAGYKLKRPWMEKVLFEGHSVRPYMATRMPRFGKDNLYYLPTIFEKTDQQPGDQAEPAFSPEIVEAGRRLVGNQGFACINCHGVAGLPSLGIPAVDLATVHERLKPAWFHQLLWNPASLNMNTRMPAFWWENSQNFPDLLEGDPHRQIDAIWSYLSLGLAMKPPNGLQVAANQYQLAVKDKVLLFGTFMKGISPRVLAVGHPEQTHYAFDLQNQRLALAWRGSFMNAKGTWHGRAGELEWPSSQDLVQLPEGPSLALLPDAEADWPEATGKEGGFQGLGRRMDQAGRPIFRYRLEDLTVEESLTPELRSGGSWFLRQFRIQAPIEPDKSESPIKPPMIYLRLARAEWIQKREDGILQTANGLFFKIPSEQDANSVILRKSSGAQELIVPISLDPETASAELRVEFTW
ncbi:MAG: hypothetical protein DWQ01_04615 [Planctomycetota bacterium]|nr:MAG: hypothetical protein DWQ01_04615 [Planctomycetota bacterium]